MCADKIYTFLYFWISGVVFIFISADVAFNSTVSFEMTNMHRLHFFAMCMFLILAK